MNRDRVELWAWFVVAIVLVALAIPWFMWGRDAVVAGLPVWLWWHVGWMALAGLVFWLFTERAWGIGIETAPGDGGTDSRAESTTGDRERAVRGESR